VRYETEGMTTKQDRLEVRRSVYGKGDLGSLSIFGGGFINFGYWRDIAIDGAITLEQRVASQQAMYELVVDTLQIGPGDRVLEVGCGGGLGASSVLRRDPTQVCGIDLMPEQVARCRQANRDPRLTFEQGSAEAIPFHDGAFNRLLSVEAAQHFEDLHGFARESHRVLEPDGQLALATFFAADEHSAPELAQLLDSFATGLDLAHSIEGVQTALRAAGFTGVTATSIGEHVWRSFDRWLAQTEYSDSWGRNWIPLVERGLVDYYLVTAHRSAAAQ
jgi:MPBQ/MSBQ methyltransferase